MKKLLLLMAIGISVSSGAMIGEAVALKKAADEHSVKYDNYGPRGMIHNQAGAELFPAWPATFSPE